VRGREDLKVHGTYGGADMAVFDMCMGLIMCLRLLSLCDLCAAVCVLQCQNVFPYAFCVCLREMREDFVVMFADRK